MKRMLVVIVSTMLMSAPAYALRVTNLDTVPHTVSLRGGGSDTVRRIAPDATEYFVGASHGFLSLESASVKRYSQTLINADGMLAGVVGEGRNQNIPADPDNSYVIWPGGKLALQSRMKANPGR